jgi:hypothetical protein
VAGSEFLHSLGQSPNHPTFSDADVAKAVQTVWKPRLRIPVDLGVWYVSAMAHLAGTDRSQLLLLPEAVDDYVGPDNPVRFIEAFVDGLDLGTAGFVRRRRDAQATIRPICSSFTSTGMTGPSSRLVSFLPSLI